MEGRSRESFYSGSIGLNLWSRQESLSSQEVGTNLQRVGKSSVKVCTMAPVPISPHRSFTLSMNSAKRWYFAKKKAKLADFLMTSEIEN